MKKITILYCIALLCVSFCYAQPYGSAGILTKVTKSQSYLGSHGYIEYLPESYFQSEKFPLILYFHGLGELGEGTSSSLDVLMNNGPVKLVNEGKSFEAVIIAPQSSNGWFSADNAKWIYDNIIDKYKIDINRIYVTGYSAGGKATWQFADAFPDIPAAIVPICGAGKVSYSAEYLLDMPCWSFHNFGDNVVSYEMTRDNFKYISGGLNPTAKNDYGIYPFGNNYSVANDDYTFQMDYEEKENSYSTSMSLDRGIVSPQKYHAFTLYNSSGHDAWTETYNNNAMWNWMFSQVREKMEEDTTTEPEVVAPTYLNLSSTDLDLEISTDNKVGIVTSDGDLPKTYQLVEGSDLFELNSKTLYYIGNLDANATIPVSIKVFNSGGEIEKTFQVSVKVIVADEPIDTVETSVTKTARLNFGRIDSEAIEGWNSIFDNQPNEGANWELSDQEGQSLGWQLEITEKFNSTPTTEFWPVATNSEYPDAVNRIGWVDKWGGEIVISGLDESKQYLITVFGNSPYSDQSVMKVEVNGNPVGKPTNVFNNVVYNREVIANNVDAIGGEVSVFVAGYNDYPNVNKAYLSAIIIEEIGNSSQRTSAFEQDAELGLEVFPNPFQNQLLISSNDMENILSVELINQMGVSIPVSANFNHGSVELDGLDELNTGIYHLVVKTENEVKTFTIVK